MATIEELDAQISELEGQISTSMEAGGGSPDYSAFYKSPGYDFRFNEGVRAIDRSASARGMLGSGGLQRELTRYGQGFASGEFNNYANRLSTLAGIGQVSGQQIGQVGTGGIGAASQDLGQSILAGGQAQASGIIGAGNAWQQGIQGAAGAIGGAIGNWQNQSTLPQWGSPTPYSGSNIQWGNPGRF